MGSACCTAAKDKDLPNRTGDFTVHRNVRCSPTWSFQWENQSRVAGEIEDSLYQMSHGLSRDVSVEMKRESGSDRGNISGGGSSHESFGTPTSPKSPICKEVHVNLMPQSTDLAVEGSYPREVKNVAQSPEIAVDLTESTHSSIATPVTDCLPTCHHPLPSNSTPSRWARRSPRHQLVRQISDSRILRLNSPGSYPSSEGRPSFMLPTWSHDLPMASHGGPSDCWSTQTSSEFLTSSQREMWSFDGEHLGCSSRFSSSSFLDLQTCGTCSKFLTEKSPWNSQRIIANNELSMVAVLVCGHVYHAKCLEAVTPEADKYDPTCPVCMEGEKQVLKMSKEAFSAEAKSGVKNHKTSSNRVVDSSLDSDSDDLDQRKNVVQEVEIQMMEPISVAASHSTKPFLRRHFSFGSKWRRSVSDNDSTRKKRVFGQDISKM